MSLTAEQVDHYNREGYLIEEWCTRWIHDLETSKGTHLHRV